jgi:hypothetical protein
MKQKRISTIAKLSLASFLSLLFNTAQAEGIPVMDPLAAIDRAVQLENEAKMLINQAKSIKDLSGLRDFAGKISNLENDMPPEWASLMGDAAKVNVKSELDKQTNINADTGMQTYLTYFKQIETDAKKSQESWTRIDGLMKEAALSDNPKLSADIANQIQAQMLIDNRNEAALKRIKETAEMQERIYQAKQLERDSCIRIKSAKYQSTASCY